MIYNRWGEMIFESHNAKIGWDGTYQGRIVQDGTYVWKIVVQKTLTNTREEFVGKVHLLR